jgi:hypothetical protein
VGVLLSDPLKLFGDSQLFRFGLCGFRHALYNSYNVEWSTDYMPCGGYGKEPLLLAKKEFDEGADFIRLLCSRVGIRPLPEGAGLRSNDS